jgi:hypothetical protein
MREDPGSQSAGLRFPERRLSHSQGAGRLVQVKITLLEALGAGQLGLGQIRQGLPTGAAILAFGHEQNRLDFGCLDMILARADEIDAPGWDNLRRASVLLNAYAARYDRNLNPI